jgi:hypothetical protein
MRSHKESSTEMRSVLRQWWSSLRPMVRWGCVLPVVIVHVVLILFTLTRPPMSADGLFYHIPLQVQWLDADQLSLWPGLWNRCMPANCELWQFFFTSLRVEPLIELALVPIGLLLALIVAGMARRLGSNLQGATIAAVFALLVPMVALQMYSAYVDMFGSAFLMGGLYWLMFASSNGRDRRGRTCAVGLAGLSTGVAAGTKLGFLSWSALIFAMLVIAMIWQMRSRRSNMAYSAVSLGRMSLVFLSAALLGGGFWYLRNYYHTGWPLYPMQLKIAGHTLGSFMPLNLFGVYSEYRGLRSLLYPWFEWHALHPTLHRFTAAHGLGPAVATFVIPVICLLTARWRRSCNKDEATNAGLMLVFFAAGVALFVFLFRSYPRFALPMFVSMIAGAGLLVGMFGRIHPRSVQTLCVAVTLSAGLMVMFWPVRDFSRRVGDGLWARHEVYGIPELFDSLPQGTTVLNLESGSLNFPLMGRDWSNRVLDGFTLGPTADQPVLTRRQLSNHGVEIVYHRGDDPPPFGADVEYEVMYDDADDPGRHATTAVTRVYRIH